MILTLMPLSRRKRRRKRDEILQMSRVVENTKRIQENVTFVNTMIVDGTEAETAMTVKLTEVVDVTTVEIVGIVDGTEVEIVNVKEAVIRTGDEDMAQEREDEVVHRKAVIVKTTEGGMTVETARIIVIVKDPLLSLKLVAFTVARLLKYSTSESLYQSKTRRRDNVKKV